MSRAPRKRFFTAAFFAVAILAGCATNDKPPPPMPDAGAQQPKLLGSLSDVSSTPVDPLGVNAVPAPGEGLLHDAGPVSAGPRTFEEDPGISREIGTERNPATVRLLNNKAAKFGNFASVILDRIYARLIIAERSEEISRTKLPTDLKAVIITAILDKSGKLTELILEQHSGKAKIDRMMLDVCKKSIWYENPPVEALSGDGNYKLTIKLKLQNFASSDEHHWSFITDLGLGIG
ncbi:MAG TPA: hypothetical protein VJX68_08995 [Candidatus Binatus sp.]|uniref:hypothetical protein n=1 Tax=Candidatus Binatus sp. TaxID=2811406 RepID=UPI002B461189|nr:hypothetical protein [Candidatus Binatus sp.]HKN13321.1 hypothetical protein [Candidatus Binatus sp.]